MQNKYQANQAEHSHARVVLEVGNDNNLYFEIKERRKERTIKNKTDKIVWRNNKLIGHLTVP